MIAPVTKRHVDAYGRDKIVDAFSAAQSAAIAAIKGSIVSLGFSSPGLDASPQAEPIPPSVEIPTMARVVFLGVYNTHRNYAQIVGYLEKIFGLVEYSGYDDAAKAEWLRVLNG